MERERIEFVSSAAMVMVQMVKNIYFKVPIAFKL